MYWAREKQVICCNYQNLKFSEINPMQAGLNMERGIKKSRVAFVLWSSEIKPLFDRFVTLFLGLLCIHCIPYIWSDFESDSDFSKKNKYLFKNTFLQYIGIFTVLWNIQRRFWWLFLNKASILDVLQGMELSLEIHLRFYKRSTMLSFLFPDFFKLLLRWASSQMINPPKKWFTKQETPGLVYGVLR